MMELRDYQERGARLLSGEIRKGGVLKFNAPTGMGRSIVLAEAVKDRETLFVSDISEIREQFSRIDGRPNAGLVCADLKNARKIVKTRSFGVIILSDHLAHKPGAAEGWGAAPVVLFP